MRQQLLLTRSLYVNSLFFAVMISVFSGNAKAYDYDWSMGIEAGAIWHTGLSALYQF